MPAARASRTPPRPLTDISPALLTKYLNAAKDVADHAVLLPDGFRFAATKTRRDWTNEATIRLQEFFRRYTPDGKLHFGPYVQALVRHRDGLLASKTSLDNVAASEKLNRKYLGVVWEALSAKDDGGPLDAMRESFRVAKPADVASLTAEISAWQSALWTGAAVGSYRNPTRFIAADPPAGSSQQVRLAVKSERGQPEATVYLASRDAAGGKVVWGRPRLEAPNRPPLLLRDYAQYGPAYERDYRSAYADTAKYLAAAVQFAGDPKADLGGLDPALVRRWADVLALGPFAKDRPAAMLTPLDEKLVRMAGNGNLNGWRIKGSDLPMVATNAGKEPAKVSGVVPPHGFFLHPSQAQAVGVSWTSPMTGTVQFSGKITDLDANCGNGVAWLVERRRGGRLADRRRGRHGQGGGHRPAAGHRQGREGRRLGPARRSARRRSQLRLDRRPVRHLRFVLGQALGPRQFGKRHDPQRQPERALVVRARGGAGQGRDGCDPARLGARALEDCRVQSGPENPAAQVRRRGARPALGRAAGRARQPQHPALRQLRLRRRRAVSHPVSLETRQAARGLEAVRP